MKPNETWRNRNYKIEFRFSYSERIDDIPEVEKGDLYVGEVSSNGMNIWWGKRKLEKLPGKVLDELIEELNHIRKELKDERNKI